MLCEILARSSHVTDVFKQHDQWGHGGGSDRHFRAPVKGVNGAAMCVFLFHKMGKGKSITYLKEFLKIF